MKNINVKLFGGILSGIALLIVLGFNLYKFIQGNGLSFSDLITIPVLLIFFLNTITWNSDQEQQDELGRMITYKSAKLSYFCLLIFIFITFLVVEFPVRSNQQIENMPLFIVLCVAVVILPAIEFFVARKYR